MVDKWTNCYLGNRNLNSAIKLNFSESYDFVLEHSKNTSFLQSRKASVPISAALNDNLTVIAQQDGYLKILRNKDLSFVYSTKAHNGVVNDVKIRPSYSNHLLTCSTDCNLILRDIETKQKLSTFFDYKHNSAIRTLEFYDSSLIATGTESSKIQLWDIRESSMKNKPIQSIDKAHLNKNISSFHQVVTSLVFNYLKYLYSCSPRDNCIKIWDLRFNNSSLVQFSELKYSGSSDTIEGFRCLALDSKFNLYASSTDNKIYQYSYQSLLNSKISDQNYSDLDNNVYNIKCFEGVSLTNYTKINVLNDLNLLVSGSNDAEVIIWNLDKTVNDFINYPTVILPHLIEEVSVVLIDSSRYEIITCDDANNVYKWILNSKLNNKFVRKYRKGRISETYNKKENKPFNVTENTNKDRKRFLSGNYDLLNQPEPVKRPFKRSRSLIERVI